MDLFKNLFVLKLQAVLFDEQGCSLEVFHIRSHKVLIICNCQCLLCTVHNAKLLMVLSQVLWELSDQLNLRINYRRCYWEAVNGHQNIQSECYNFYLFFLDISRK